MTEKSLNLSFQWDLCIFKLYRHGARAPVAFYPTNPIKQKDWPEGRGGLTQVSCSFLFIKTVTSSWKGNSSCIVYSNLFIILTIVLLMMFWSYFLCVFLGKIKLFLYLKKGMMLEYELGKFLKARYIKTEKFIHPEYLHKEVCLICYQSRLMLFKAHRESLLKICVFSPLLASKFHFMIIIPQCFKVGYCR